jgi:hypothetical protein
MLKGIKNRVKKVKNKIRSISRSSSPNPQSAASRNPTPDRLADPASGTASAVQDPSSEAYANIPFVPQAENTASNTESLTPSIGSGTALAIRIPVPAISVQPPSDVYAGLIVSSDVRDKTSAASIGFQGFKTALTLVREAADAFPPLKSVAGGLLGLIDIVEVREFDHSYHCSNIVHADDVPESSRSCRTSSEDWSHGVNSQYSPI